MKTWKGRAVFALWTVCIVIGAIVSWRIVMDVLGTTSLAVIATGAFVGLAALAGPPKLDAEDLSFKLSFLAVVRALWVLTTTSIMGALRATRLFAKRTAMFPRVLYEAWKDRKACPILVTIRFKYRFEEGRFRAVTADKPDVPADKVSFLRAWAVFIRTVLVVRSVIALYCAGLVLAGVFLLGLCKEKFIAQMPNDMRRVTEYDPAVATDVYDRNGEHVCSFNTQYRVRLRIDKMGKLIPAAVTAAEDDAFYRHHGIDPMAIARAAYKNLAGGRTKQGGSTITQQVVKQVLLANSERTIRRKVQEIILAVELERRLTKAQILEVYLNHVFLGHNAYGVEAAARTYFGKSASEVTVAEAALLAGLPQAPSRYSPFSHYPVARERMRYVLGRMQAIAAITPAQHREALAEEIAVITVADPLNRSSAPYFCDLVRRELKSMFSNTLIFDRGIVAHTTLDMAMQRKAEASVRLGLLDLERRLGYAGAEDHDKTFDGECKGPVSEMADGALGRAVVMIAGNKPKVCMRGVLYPLHPEDIARMRDWEKKGYPVLAPGDVLTMRIETVTEPTSKGPVAKRYALPARRTGGAQVKRALQAAMVVADPKTGELRALVGGYDFAENQYNNATMALRQTGSAVKPFVYLSGLMHGMTVADRMVDNQRCYGTASGTWCPRNYDDKFYGEVDLRTALAKSLNSISVQIGVRVGVDEIIRTMRRLGVTAKLDRALPITVGSEDLTPWEMTYANVAIAAGGKRIPRHPGSDRAGVFLTKVEDNTGKTIFTMPQVPRKEWPQVVPSADNYALIELMKGVVEQGTGQRVRELRRPAAGKTGTTNNSHDVWYMGFTTDLVAGVWIGRQSSHYSIGGDATGGAVALPLWLAFMKSAHPDVPPTDFPPPDDILLVPNYFGQLTPFQQGRIPEDYLIGSKGLDESL